MSKLSIKYCKSWIKRFIICKTLTHWNKMAIFIPQEFMCVCIFTDWGKQTWIPHFYMNMTCKLSAEHLQVYVHDSKSSPSLMCSSSVHLIQRHSVRSPNQSFVGQCTSHVTFNFPMSSLFGPWNADLITCCPNDLLVAGSSRILLLDYQKILQFWMFIFSSTFQPPWSIAYAFRKLPFN